MTKYNLPPNILEDMRNLRGRLDRLERYTKPTSITVIRPTKLSDYDTLVVVSSGTFATTHVFPCVFLAATPVVRIAAVCSDGTTAGEFRLVDGDDLALTARDGSLVPPKGIPAGTITETAFENDQDPNYWDDFPIGSDLMVKLQVRRTAGTGTISIRVKYLIQVPS